MRFGRDRLDRLVHPPRKLLCEVAHQHGDVLTAVPERRHMDWEHVQTVEEVLPELLLVGKRRQVAIGRRDETRVGAQRARAAEPLELALLEHAKQLRLELERDLADLVEEHRAAIGQLEPADALSDGARERALLVTEQLALEKPRRNGRAVQLDERVVMPATQLMDGAGDELLARSRLAETSTVESVGATV